MVLNILPVFTAFLPTAVPEWGKECPIESKNERDNQSNLCRKAGSKETRRKRQWRGSDNVDSSITHRCEPVVLDFTLYYCFVQI